MGSEFFLDDVEKYELNNSTNTPPIIANSVSQLRFDAGKSLTQLDTGS